MKMCESIMNILWKCYENSMKYYGNIMKILWKYENMKNELGDLMKKWEDLTIKLD